MDLQAISNHTIMLLIGLLAGFIGHNFIKGFKQCPKHEQIHVDVELLKRTLEDIKKGIEDLKKCFDSETGVWARLRLLETRVSVLEKKKR